MSFRERMQVKVSNAEMDVFVELQRRSLTIGMRTQHGFVFDLKRDIVAGTWIDFYWGPPYQYAVFIDGNPIHLKSHQERRDMLVDAALERRGIKVDRFMYRVPLRKYRLQEICDQIEDVLKNGCEP